ncbi:MAG: PDC sensor domain-containing protein, partial [Bacteroidales bacterium]|nr:PDC sensor domain-containing protein [Candidatus Cryptobacteroides fimicaballi]
MKHGHSFSAKLTLNVLTMMSALFLLSLGIVSYWSNTLISNEAAKNAQNLLDKNISDIEKILSTIETSVSGNAWNVREHLDDPDFLYHITERIVGENPNIVGSAIAFVPEFYEGKHFFSPYSYVSADSGKILSKQLGNDDYDYFYMEWFSVPFETGTPLWGEPYFD